MTETKQVTASPGEAAILTFQESTAKKLMAMHHELFALRLLVNQVYAFAYAAALSSTMAAMVAAREMGNDASTSLEGIEKSANKYVLDQMNRWETVAFEMAEKVIAKGREEIQARERDIADARTKAEP